MHLYDTGHFALETHAEEIAGAIRDFLGRKVPRVRATTRCVTDGPGPRQSL